MQSQVNSSSENAPVMVKKANEVHDFKYKMKKNQFTFHLVRVCTISSEHEGMVFYTTKIHK
jgi:hypothetical protein